MAFANSGDPNINPKESEFDDQFPAGTYTMVGIEDFFSLDDNELPIFKPVQNEVRAHCHLKLKEKVSGKPAWSGTAQDYARLAEALGADISDLKVRSDTEFLLEIQQRVNDSGGTSGVYVGVNGWVKKINKMLPPTGTYRVQFAGAFCLDGGDIIRFQNRDTPFGTRSVVRFAFEIVGDVDDDRTYAGERFTIEVTDPFDGVFNGLPAWRHAKNGGMLVGQRRLLTFLQIFWPEVEDYNWINDPEDSEFGINEAENPIHVIVQKALESDAQAIVRIETNEKGFIKADLQDLSPTRSKVPTTAKPKQKPNVQVKHLTLIKTINDLSAKELDGQKAIESTTENPYNLTPEGKAWCKKHVVPVWDQLGFGSKRSFDILSLEQAKQLVENLLLVHGPAEQEEDEDDF